jgi:hypothetical protein
LCLWFSSLFLFLVVPALSYAASTQPNPLFPSPICLFQHQVHRLSGTLVQASVYQQQLSNLTLMVGFIHAHQHAQAVLQKHIQVGAPTTWVF